MYIWIKDSDSVFRMTAISSGESIEEIDNHMDMNKMDSFFGVEGIYEKLRELVNNYKFDELNEYMRSIGWEYDYEMCTSNGYVDAYAFRKIEEPIERI